MYPVCVSVCVPCVSLSVCVPCQSLGIPAVIKPDGRRCITFLLFLMAAANDVARIMVVNENRKREREKNHQPQPRVVSHRKLETGDGSLFRVANAYSNHEIFDTLLVDKLLEINFPAFVLLKLVVDTCNVYSSSSTS